MKRNTEGEPNVTRIVMAESETLVYDPNLHDETLQYAKYNAGFAILKTQIVKIEGEPRQRVISVPVGSVIIEGRPTY